MDAVKRGGNTVSRYVGMIKNINSIETAQNYLRDYYIECSYSIIADNRIIGEVGITELGSAELNRKMQAFYWLVPDYWKRGLARAAVKALEDVAFKTGEIGRIEFEIMEGNASSINLAEKLDYNLRETQDLKHYGTLNIFEKTFEQWKMANNGME